ncbi:roadblock/LC7 domain-containing protein [Acinetobacter sp.]|uniref:roadblock/LC7 domain-containing protein n=1 Tax=Acinetobacter sp. TaxID=472 RepID=UPI0035B3822C
MSFSREIPQEIKEQSRVQVQNFLHEISGIEFVMLCSSDGFELATASKKNLDNHGKIAAVSSSIMAMVAAFISEIQLVGCQAITLDAENGKVFLSAVNHPQFPMVLIAVTDNDLLIGQMRYHFQKLSEALAQMDFALASI